MTVDEKREALNKMCKTRGECDATFDGILCPLYELSHCETFNFNEMSDEAINECYDKAFSTPIEEPVEQVEDVIKHPNHYCRDGAMECIDEMIMLFGKEVVKHFCLCNIHKYRYRSNAKNGEEDIKKSDQYVRIYKELNNE